jgi:serine/threonine-protein kinase HipA
MNHLIVKLGDVIVGDLRRRSGDSWEFRFRADYMGMHPRPVLGQLFEDDLRRIYRSTLRLPPFFSNLLPEGPLRQLVARHADINEQREALLIEALGGDLPGAIVVEPGDEGNTLDEEDRPSAPTEESSEHEPRLKFSLAGVQLKFSVLQQGNRLTLPASGQGGNWIVKLPDARHPRVPANEYSMLQWAEASGIEVPEHKLIPISQIDGLPQDMALAEKEALAVRRFDRTPTGRIHQEDFAQVLGLYPERKYKAYNYETIGNIVHAVAGPEALVEYARRLTFVVLSGNGDAHHKNWSLRYQDGRRASLSPAYDLVFTKAYIGEDELALKLDGSRQFADVTFAAFRRLARRCGFDEDLLITRVSETASHIRTVWTELEAEMPLTTEVKSKLRQHLESVHLLG